MRPWRGTSARSDSRRAGDRRRSSASAPARLRRAKRRRRGLVHLGERPRIDRVDLRTVRHFSRSISTRTYRSSGSFSAAHRSISPSGTYDWLSCSACPLRRYVISSISVTPPPERARSTARRVAVVHREHVVAVGAVAGDAVAGRLVDELVRGALLRHRRGVGVAVVLDDHHERAALDRREVDPLVKRAGARRAVADVDEPHAILAAHLERERDAGHERDHVAELRDLADEAAAEIAEVEPRSRPRVGESRLRHVLADHLDRRRALHEHRAEVADERREHVARFQRERASRPRPPPGRANGTGRRRACSGGAGSPAAPRACA